jgi:adenylate cyclase
MKGVARRLSAILVADLVGYTEHMRGNETGTHQQVTSDLSTIFSPRIAAHDGRVVKTTGDGLLAEFASVVDCIECAVEIQHTLAEREQGTGDGAAFEYRMAVNVGDLIIEHDDIYGDGVNLAVKLQGIGRAGDIVLSHDTYRQAKGKLNVEFEDFGAHPIKGVDELVQVYRVIARGGILRPPRSIERSPSAIPTIAVLPFDNLTGDRDRSYLCDGITNDIITDLSKYSQLFVLASHTVFAYKSRSGNIQSLSRALGVRYLVEGSIQSAGDRLRINAQLIVGETGMHLWAHRYDQPMSDIFALQDQIVQTIVGTLVTRVHLSEQQRALRSRPESLEAYDLYLRGRAAFASWTQESNQQAQQYFRHALERDPNFALAFGYLSYTLVQSWWGGWERSPAILQQARELAERAVALGPSEFDSYWSLAAAYLASREFDKSIAAYERAIALNPNCPNLLVDMAEALVYVGRAAEAVAHIQRAMLLNPIYPDWYLWTLGIAHYHTGDYERAVGALTRGNPPNLARRHLVAAYVRLGRAEDARRVASDFLTREPTYTLEREQAWPYRDADVLESFLADLKKAGLPELLTNAVERGG